MACRDEVVRMIVKYSETEGVVPTVPSSENHQDGSWLPTDIYKGEFFFNKADGLMYTRDDNGILEVETREYISAEYIALVTQSGTNAPTAVVIKDTMGGISWGYNAVGQYTADCDPAVFGNVFTVGNFGVVIGSFDSINDQAIMYRLDDNTLRLDTFVSAVATNGVLNGTLIHIRVMLP